MSIVQGAAEQSVEADEARARWNFRGLRCLTQRRTIVRMTNERSVTNERRRQGVAWAFLIALANAGVFIVVTLLGSVVSLESRVLESVIGDEFLRIACGVGVAYLGGGVAISRWSRHLWIAALPAGLVFGAWGGLLWSQADTFPTLPHEMGVFAAILIAESMCAAAGWSLGSHLWRRFG